MASRTLAHDAMFYDSDREFASALTPFVRDGLAGDDAVVAAVTVANAGVLRDALGKDASAVSFIDRDEWYQRPASTVAGWQRLLQEATSRGHRHVRLIGEVGFGAEDRHPTWTRYESALNRVFADVPAWIVCPYDSRELPATVLDDAKRTHPTVFGPGRPASAGFLSPEQLLLLVPEPLPPVAGPPMLDLPITDEVAAARNAVRDLLAARGWAGTERGDDLMLAMSESVTNGIRHGRGRRRLRVWVDGDTVTCEVTDEGSGPADPLAGYRPPAQLVTGGRGLWITQQICDAAGIEHRDGTTAARFAITMA